MTEFVIRRCAVQGASGLSPTWGEGSLCPTWLRKIVLSSKSACWICSSTQRSPTCFASFQMKDTSCCSPSPHCALECSQPANNAVNHIETLVTVVNAWVEGVAQWRPYILQQDSAPSHIPTWSKSGWLKIFMIMWLLTCDFLGLYIASSWTTIFWGVIEREVNQWPHNTRTVEGCCQGCYCQPWWVPADQGMRTFRSCIQTVIDVKGCFIE